jgi:hypothetical protein
VVVDDVIAGNKVNLRPLRRTHRSCCGCTHRIDRRVGRKLPTSSSSLERMQMRSK